MEDGDSKCGVNDERNASVVWPHPQVVMYIMYKPEYLQMIIPLLLGMYSYSHLGERW